MVTIQETLATQIKILQVLLEKTSRIREPVKCHECGGPHFKRQCPQLKKKEDSVQKAGNEKGLAKLLALIGQDPSQ